MDITDFHRNNTYGFYVEKDPDSVMDFMIDWGDWLLDNNTDMILTSTWAVPVGVTVVNDQIVDDFTVLWLGASTAGLRIPITNRITTAGGRVQDQSFTLIVRDE